MMNRINTDRSVIVRFGIKSHEEISLGSLPWPVSPHTHPDKLSCFPQPCHFPDSPEWCSRQRSPGNPHAGLTVLPGSSVEAGSAQGTARASGPESSAVSTLGSSDPPYAHTSSPADVDKPLGELKVTS